MDQETARKFVAAFEGLASEKPEKPQDKPVSLPQMRTLPKAIEELRKRDPGTSYTLSALRRDVKQGKIPCLTVSTKTLVNMADVYRLFGYSAER